MDLNLDKEADIDDEDMPRRPTSPLSQKDVLAELRAKRAYHAEQVAYIDNLLAGIDRALGGDAGPLLAAGSPSAVSAANPAGHKQPTTFGLKQGCFHGYSFAAAAAAAIPLIGDKDHPPSTGMLVAAIASTGYPISATQPDSVLNGALRKREINERDVILLGNGLWGLMSWYTEEEITHYRLTRGAKPLRNGAKHGEATRKGMQTALERGVHIGRPRLKLTPEALKLAAEMLLTGHSMTEVASAVHVTPQALYSHLTIERDEQNRIINVALKRENGAQQEDLRSTSEGDLKELGLVPEPAQVREKETMN